MVSTSARIPEPPVSSDASEAARINQQRLRHDILHGMWRQHLIARITLMVGNVRTDAWGEPDMTANALRSISAQQAVLFDGRPEGPRVRDDGTVEDPVEIAHTDAPDEAAEVLAHAVREAWLWPLMQRVQRDTLGIREVGVRLDTNDDGELLFRPVYPHLVHAERDPQRPGRLQRFEEARPRLMPPPRNSPDAPREYKWCWDVLEVDGKGVGRYRVLGDRNGRANLLEDLSPLFLTDEQGNPAPEGGLQGEAYPYRWSNGTAYVPAVIFHGAVTGELWDPWEWTEVAEGTLNLGVYWTFWAHVLRTCSWPQRYAAGVHVVAMGQGGELTAQRGEVTTDPSLLLIFSKDADFDGQPIIGQFDAGADPVTMGEAIAAYERRIVAAAGLSPSDIQRVSGDPRSGYALQISREAQQEASQRLAPVFAPPVQLLLAMCAAQLNAWARGAGKRLPELPERGWIVRFLRLAREEAESERTPATDGRQPEKPEPEKPAIDPNVEKLQDTALNGAQVASALDIVIKVGLGQVPKAAAEVMLAEFFNLDPTTVSRMLSSVEEGGTAPAPAPTAQQPPPPADGA